MNRKKKQILVAWLFAFPSLAGVMLFYGYPFLIILVQSLTAIREGHMVWRGWIHYRSLYANPVFRLSMLNTLWFTVIAVPLVLAFSYLLTIPLRHKRPGFHMLRSLFIVPMILPAAAISLFWQLTAGDNGFLNTGLTELGLPTISFMRGAWGMGFIIFIFVWKNCGYNMILFIAGLNRIPLSLYESASLDGATPVVLFFRITLPMLRSTLFLSVLFTMMQSLKIFREVYPLTGRYPDTTLYFVQHYMNNQFEKLQFARLSATSVTMSVLATGVMLLLFTLERKSVVYDE